MKSKMVVFLCCFIWIFAVSASADDVSLSEATEECLDCHATIHPGIVEDWRSGRHAQTSPKAAMNVEGLARKLSSTTVPKELQSVAVGCAECHTLRPKAHSDTFEHNGYEIHVVVSPDDCQTCHETERRQFSKNIMAHAYGNLKNNSLYADLEHTILASPVKEDSGIRLKPANDTTKAEACYYCHGTRLEVTGYETRDTEAAGELTFPMIKGWPNQGVGRINLDGSMGACSACHTRHAFSIEMARKPYTCKQCHDGPDAPAFKVYSVSKHGTIFSTQQHLWDFGVVPWTIGKDFKAPTCASCHISLLVNTDEEVVSKRTHQMNDRLPWRIFGLIYAHPHPKDPDTSRIRTQNDLPLPTDLNGQYSTRFLIDEKEQQVRKQAMQASCLNCHSHFWVQQHWKRFENAIKETHAKTLTGTRIMEDIWRKGYANPKDSLFDEAVERKWTDLWLYFGNSVRYAAAMGGGGDYGVFATGRYPLSKGIFELNDWLKLRKKVD
jgi:hydroxylamine dehydrogenase